MGDIPEFFFELHDYKTILFKMCDNSRIWCRLSRSIQENAGRSWPNTVPIRAFLKI